MKEIVKDFFFFLFLILFFMNCFCCFFVLYTKFSQAPPPPPLALAANKFSHFQPFSHICLLFDYDNGNDNIVFVSKWKGNGRIYLFCKLSYCTRERRLLVEGEEERKCFRARNFRCRGWKKRHIQDIHS